MNGNYGVTPFGIRPKRLDEILEELHTDLSAGFGVNTRLNPESFLNVQATAYADKIAELWELGEQIYFSMYPFSAEAVSLDNSVQFGGIAREDARPTFYPVHAEAIDGTVIPRGSVIRTDTSPTIRFEVAADTEITRSSFNKAVVRVAVVQGGAIYTVSLNGMLHSYTSGADDTEQMILDSLIAALENDNFVTTLMGMSISIEDVDPQRTSELVLSGNLTTQSVTGIVNYASETVGDVLLPNETITQIVTAVPGLLSVTNLTPRIAGRLRETDVELRRSYADKIFARSSRMLDSIKSAIINNVQGVTAVAGYQNDTSEMDAYGRWAHSIEMVVDGGSDYEVALQIWDKKTDGIQTFGSTEVVVPGDEGEPMTMRFNRPEHVYVWFRISITRNLNELLPPNYVEAIQSIVVTEMGRVEPGKPIVPQRLVDNRIYTTVPGIAFIETMTFATTDAGLSPDAEDYTAGMVPITPRQRGITTDTRVEVILSA